MITRVIARYLRISPRKTRGVTRLVKGMPVIKAEILLNNLNKRPMIYIKRLLSSAIDSADKKASIAPADLYISLIKADVGPTLKRFRAASMGRASTIRHRTTHLTLELDRIKRPEKKATTKETGDKTQATKDAKKTRKEPKKKTAAKKENK